jgi:hypothetical protein
MQFLVDSWRLSVVGGRGRENWELKAGNCELPKEVLMSRDRPTPWRLDRRVNLSVLLQLLVLASLILGSWVNLQRQLDSLQHDVTALLTSQKEFQQRLERLSERAISHEYRLQTLEKGRNG